MQSHLRCLQKHHHTLLLVSVRYSSTQNHYSVLGVKQNATKKEIRHAFLELSKKHHPDQNKALSGSHEKFVKINEAYTVLSKDASRQQYDLSLRTGRPPSRHGSQGAAYRPYQQPPGSRGGYYDPYGRSHYNPYGQDPYGRQNPFEDFYERHGQRPFDEKTREEFYQRQREAYKREREYHQKQSQANKAIALKINRMMTQVITFVVLTYLCFIYMNYQFSAFPSGRNEQFYRERENVSRQIPMTGFLRLVAIFWVWYISVTAMIRGISENQWKKRRSERKTE